MFLPPGGQGARSDLKKAYNRRLLTPSWRPKKGQGGGRRRGRRYPQATGAAHERKTPGAGIMMATVKGGWTCIDIGKKH